MIGVICPSSFEYKALDRKFIQKKNGVIFLSGMGKVRVLCACADLVRKYPELRAIALIGFAGALTPNLKIGDVVEPNVFIEQDYNAEPLEKFPHILRRKHSRWLKGSSDAVMLTQDKFLKDNPLKGGADEKKFKKVVCDMESYAAAYFCERQKIRYAVVKIISDCADDSADHDFLKACRGLSLKLNDVTLKLICKLA